MKLRLAHIAPLAALHLLPVPAAAQCQLCSAEAGGVTVGSTDRNAALRIEVETQLDFSRVATGDMGGDILIDPLTGMRKLNGDLLDLGGMALTGVVRVNGTPGAALRVTLPGSIMLEGRNGNSARVTGLVTDLGAAPRLGPDGSLRFHFGGRLRVDSADDGDYRGRIPITVEYQ